MTTTTTAPPAHRADPPQRWWRRPWMLPLGAVCLVFLAYALPPYLTLDTATSRIPPPEGSALYYPLLVTHIGFGTVAMVTGFLQVWPWFRGRYPVAHRRLGRVYVLGGVLPASICAFGVALAAPFGPMAMVSSLILASLWFGCTVTGFVRARQRRFGEHRIWMVRSYTLTVSTITNRVWQPVFFLLLAPELDTTFGGSQLALIQTVAGLTTWLGWVLPLLVMEWWMQHGLPARQRGAKRA